MIAREAMLKACVLSELSEAAAESASNKWSREAASCEWPAAVVGAPAPGLDRELQVCSATRCDSRWSHSEDVQITYVSALISEPCIDKVGVGWIVPPKPKPSPPSRRAA